MTQRRDAFGVNAQADISDARYRRNHCPTLFETFGAIQVSNAFFGQDVGDVIAINHHRRKRHSGGFRDFNGIKFFDESRFYTRLECFDHLHHQLFTALHGVRFGFHVQPGGRRMTTTVRIVAHVWRTAEARETTARHR
ncbi:hypothetical protein D3C78_612170 [compost metagenome]